MYVDFEFEFLPVKKAISRTDSIQQIALHLVQVVSCLANVNYMHSAFFNS